MRAGFYPVHEAGDTISFPRVWYRTREEAVKKIVGIKKLFPISVVFVSKEKMRELHGSYYGAVKVTDVLSFFYQKEVGISYEYGELFLCTSYIIKQAQRYRVTFEQELTRLLIHGVLHIYGFDHVKVLERKKMNAMTNEILAHIKKS